MSSLLGRIAPDFSLKDGHDNQFELSNHIGKWLVIIFLPTHKTPFCVSDCVDFSNNFESFKRFDADIVAICCDTPYKNVEFVNKFGIKYPVLNDNGEVSRKYNSIKLLNVFNKQIEDVSRNIYLINPQGYIDSVFTDTSTIGRSSKVLEKLKTQIFLRKISVF
jgi:peroxiredoxin Q/BCP